MTVKFLSGLLLLLAAYQSWWALSNLLWLWLIGALISALCGLGLAFKRRWAGYLWFFIAASVCIWWAISLARLLISGWPGEWTMEVFVSLIPGFVLGALCVGGSLAVRTMMSRRDEPL